MSTEFSGDKSTRTDEIVLTQEGVRKLEQQLMELKTVKRQEVAERIKAAIAFGDLTENAEYDEAKNEQAFMEGQILNIETTLRKARVVKDTELSKDSISIGSSVRVMDASFDEELDYVIVGATEAEPMAGRILNESPVGRALLGHHVGDEVEVQVPAGTLMLRILAIS